MGIDNRRAEKLIEAIRYFSSGTAISMDSNRLRAVVGRNRPLTRLETELRSSATTRLFGAVDSQVLALNGESVDYTDLIASPSQWAAAEQLSAIANAAGMTEHERSGFAADPDQFLQSAIRGTDLPTWMEHPLMSLELDRAWEQHVERRIRSGTRSAAIVGVFADTRISGQTNC